MTPSPQEAHVSDACALHGEECLGLGPECIEARSEVAGLRAALARERALREAAERVAMAALPVADSFDGDGLVWLKGADWRQERLTLKSAIDAWKKAKEAAK